MRILIDGRFYGLENAGIGRYVINLLKNLAKKDKKNDYIILLRKKYFGEISFPDNFKKALAEIPHYSFKEQLKLPRLIKNQEPDVVHFPHFNIPVLYPGRFIVTIHDLIKHTSRGAATTTQTPWLYWPKYLGYRLVFTKAVKNSSKIIVPSRAVKDELVKTYQVPDKKIVVTYEGVEEKFQPAISPPTGGPSGEILSKYKISKPFVIYTGSVYPHKNIKRLLQAIKLINQGRRVKLVISCARGVFWERLEKKAKELGVYEFVNLAGFIPDEDLARIYQYASCFVFPTLSEGFGLPGLEAMNVGLPVVCSDIPVLREIYGNAAIYFDPSDTNDIAQKIKEVCSYDSNHRNKIIEKGLRQVKKYSWQKMASSTLKAYESCARLFRKKQGRRLEE